MKDGDLLVAFLRKKYVYDGNGTLRNKNTGREVSKKSRRGYRVFRAAGRELRLHRAIFAMEHGYFPEQVDHEDRDRANNKIGNLRGCTTQEQNRNRTGKKRLLGERLPKGVYNHRGLYKFSLTVTGFATVKEAKEEYDRVAGMVHGKFFCS